MRIVISTVVWYGDDEVAKDTIVRELMEVARGHEVVIVPPEGDLKKELAAADVFFPFSGRTLTPDVLEAGPNLRWVHLASAGVEHALFPALVERPITVTNAGGVYAVPIAEHVLGMMLALSRDFPAIFRQQQERKWEGVRGGELLDATALVIGLGGIGRRIARLLKACGMTVIATRRHPENPDPDADHVYPADALPTVLPMADWVILAAPATSDTQRLISATELALMKPTARLVNISRGALVDEAALTAALQAGALAGAALDVFESEPLPPESPLWAMENVIVSPHTSGSSPRGMERTLALFLDNLRRFLANEPLRNVVDKTAGY